MIDELNILRGEDLEFNSFITIHFPTLEEIRLAGEEEYFATMYKFCSTSSDYKVQLDDAGVDYSEINDYEFFIMMYSTYTESEKKHLKLMFGDFDITSFTVFTRKEFNDVVLVKDDLIFDNATYLQLVKVVREIHSFERKVDKPGNEHTKKYVIDKERRQQKNARRIKKKKESILSKYIVALVNTPEFKYDYETVWDLTLYMFYRSLSQIQILKNYHFIMQGMYGGFVSSKDIDTKSIHWLNKK